MKLRFLTVFITSLLLLTSFQNTLAQKSDSNDGQSSTDFEKMAFVSIYITIKKDGVNKILNPIGIVDLSQLKYGDREEYTCKFNTDNFRYFANFSLLEQELGHIRFFGGRQVIDDQESIIFVHSELNLHGHLSTRVIQGTPGNNPESFYLEVQVIEKTNFESFLSGWLVESFYKIETIENMFCEIKT